ncbi:uncharacterized protein JCM15063_004087 [Sporobolomyces koalae]|uniref:uncharacterized protein n=1 Tax=Sporobolomyces koalae TaxID=500713 RepID=UPI00316BAB56
MGNNPSVPLASTAASLALDGGEAAPKKPHTFASVQSQTEPSSAAPPVWRRASEPAALPRRKSILIRKPKNRQGSNERNEVENVHVVPVLTISEGPKKHDDSLEIHDSEDDREGLMIRVNGRKFSQEASIALDDVLESLERITRSASTTAISTTGDKMPIFPSKKGPPRDCTPAFTFDVNYSLNGPQVTSFVASPALHPIPSSNTTDVSPFDSPPARHPRSPISHWSPSSASGLSPRPMLTPAQAASNIAAFRPYPILPVTPGTHRAALDDPVIELRASSTASTHSSRSRLGGMLKVSRSKSSKRKSREVGKIVVLKAERMGDARYAELARTSNGTPVMNTSSASSSSQPSPAMTSRSAAPSPATRASWMQLDQPSFQVQHSSPSDTQIGSLIPASPLVTAVEASNLFVPFESELLSVDPAPVKVSTRLPYGHPAASYQNRFSSMQRRSPIAVPRPRFSNFSRSSSYRSSAYTTGSRHSVVSEVESTSSALQATVQQGFRTSRVDSVSIPMAELLAADLPSFTLSLPSLEPKLCLATPRRVSIASVPVTVQRRNSEGSALSLPRSDTPEWSHAVGGRRSSITSTLISDGPTSHSAAPPPVPVDFGGYSLAAEAPRRRPSLFDVAPETGSRLSPPLYLGQREARTSSSSSLPALTSATTTSCSSQSSDGPSSSLQVPPSRPYGRLSLESPDVDLLSLSSPLPSSTPYKTINFDNYSFLHPKDGVTPRLPPRALSPTAPAYYDLNVISEYTSSPIPPSNQHVPNLNDFGWNRASAGDILHPTPSTCNHRDERRETYPLSHPARTHYAGDKYQMFDSLVHQAMDRLPGQRKRGMSKEEVESWLVDRSR